MFDLLAQEDQHHAKYLSDLLKQWTFKQSTFFQKKKPHSDDTATAEQEWITGDLWCRHQANEPGDSLIFFFFP